METEDKKLIEEYLNGDNGALASLVERNLKLVYRFAFRLARDAHDAEDITQETFVKLWKSLQKFDSDKNFKTWLLSIAHNTAVDVLRKRRGFVFSDFDLPDGGNSIVDTLVDTAPLPPEIFIRAEDKKVLDSALGGLAPQYREVLNLHHEEELTFNEIGIILNKPLNTVKSQYRRAILALQEVLK
jgi:RNA polymerase sigma-70 factor (ECF subfamily)